MESGSFDGRQDGKHKGDGFYGEKISAGQDVFFSGTGRFDKVEAATVS